MNIYFLGRHSHRTPLSYLEYQRLFNGRITIVNNPIFADFLVLGFYIDIRDNIEEIKRVKRLNPNVKVIVLSEEPLWDTLWSPGFECKNNVVNIDGYKLSYYNLNHQNSNIYDFERIPYFITTSDDYLIRYAMLFSANSKLSCSFLSSSLKKAKYRLASYAEKRIGEKYMYINGDCIGLCDFRSRLAENYTKEPDALVVGQGWYKNEKRQSLVDWHLDKLANLNRQCTFVSAVENTHQRNYITEKIFDAFALCSIPIYYASKEHNINKIIKDNSFVNLHGLSIEESRMKIDDLEISNDLVESYFDQMKRLRDCFSDSNAFTSERNARIERIVNNFELL
ncbi:TPA: hypothetical protein NKQ48_000726 [Vibrio parahaemolyticus]|nr:hypothetical protein [Vibrio parahaemolyticus]MBE4362142.1 hypothetical protein [Vibrio parahaemolyticus]MBE5185248.1 hypothetical protein [Vibrio parahaemolyticus]MBE5198762.1 hypothetical protein [Vibrio parahaemolyticus]HCG8166700.1 hypothetical protein [Vibrio parahaemolyticus]